MAISPGNDATTTATMISICLINQKGGCGKSSTCFHLAGHFALAGRRVLLIDADPQGSLSQGFFGSSLVESLEPQETLASLFDDSAFVSNFAALPMQTPIESIAVVPANQTLAPFNVPSPDTTGMRQFILREFLETIGAQGDFDIALIDCPPNLYQCSWNAMVAADFVVIPVPPEDFGTQGLRAVHQASDHAARLNPKLELLGHLVTRYDRRLVVHQTYEKKLRTLFGSAIMDTMIPEASAFKVALACRKPVTHYSAKSTAARLTRALGEECIGRMNGFAQKSVVA